MRAGSHFVSSSSFCLVLHSTIRVHAFSIAIEYLCLMNMEYVCRLRSKWNNIPYVQYAICQDLIVNLILNTIGSFVTEQESIDDVTKYECVMYELFKWSPAVVFLFRLRVVQYVRLSFAAAIKFKHANVSRRCHIICGTTVAQYEILLENLWWWIWFVCMCACVYGLKYDDGCIETFVKINKIKMKRLITWSFAIIVEILDEKCSRIDSIYVSRHTMVQLW